MIEIALRFGWIAQTIVVVAAVILVFYKSFYEDWNKESKKHKKINISVGSAITFKSNADSEYDECLLKAEPMIKSLK